jgi:hypothetical protein
VDGWRFDALLESVYDTLRAHPMLGRERPMTDPIGMMQDRLVSRLRSGARAEPGSQKAFAIVALMCFDALMPLQPGGFHRLTFDLYGNRYALRREYCATRQDFLAEPGWRPTTEAGSSEPAPAHQEPASH